MQQMGYINIIRRVGLFMTENNFFNFTGTSGNIKKELIKNVVFNKPQADILFERIKQNQDLFSDNESFTELSVNVLKSSETLNFLADDASYFINVKFLTLAFICLIFDIAISNGFASFLLTVFGIDFAAIKLNNMEKCVAYKIKTEKRIGVEQLKALNQCNFTTNSKNCRYYNNDGTCGNWTDDDIQEAINSLITKKIIQTKEKAYEIIF